MGQECSTRVSAANMYGTAVGKVDGRDKLRGLERQVENNIKVYIC